MALSDDGGGPDLQPVASFDTVFVTEYPKMVALAAAVSGSRLHGLRQP